MRAAEALTDPEALAVSEGGPGAEAAGGVSAIVVNYNAGAHLRDCVASLRADGVSEVVVVDNGSTDGSTAALLIADPNVVLVTPDRNLGYGGGANAGFAATSPEARSVLVLNPDALLAPGAVAALQKVLDADPAAGVVGPAIIDTAGQRYPSARRFPALADAIGHGFVGLVWPANPASRRYRMLDEDPDRQRAVDWVSGACFLVRRAAFESVQGFDAAFFMFSEDVDLCWRLGRAGWTIVYEPAARVTHVQGVSRAHHRYRMIVAHHRSLLRFSARTTSGWKRLGLPIVALGLLLRGLLVAGRTVLGRPPL